MHFSSQQLPSQNVITISYFFCAKSFLFSLLGKHQYPHGSLSARSWATSEKKRMYSRNGGGEKNLAGRAAQHSFSTKILTREEQRQGKGQLSRTREGTNGRGSESSRSIYIHSFRCLIQSAMKHTAAHFPSAKFKCLAQSLEGDEFIM